MRFGFPFLGITLLNMAQDPSIVTSKVQYLASADEGRTATFYASEAGVGEFTQQGAKFASFEVAVRNGRDDMNTFDIDKQGFQLVEHTSAVKDFRDDQQVQDVYYKEIEEILLKYVKGAKRVEIFDHTRRASTAELRKELSCREPSAMVHNDYTDKSAAKRLNDILAEEAENLLKQRFSIVKVWRSTAGTIQSSPLAFIDSTSMEPEKDLVSVKRVSKDRIGELQMALFNEKHQWFYFPEMQSNEALIFKTYDKSTDINRFTLHTSLEDVGSKAVPRQSIEVRAFVFC
jgi:hypothetical protein